MQTPQHVRVFDLVAPVFLQGRQQHLLGVVVLGKRARRANNLHGCSVSEAWAVSQPVPPYLYALQYSSDADFEVCPFSEGQPGVRQRVCIEVARKRILSRRE